MTSTDMQIIEHDFPASAVLRVERQRGYGSVPGLDDEELASLQKLEWDAFVADWGPILDLPVRKRDRWIKPTIDEFGHVDWGAFGTVDFQRMYPPFDKARYKADRLREQLRNDSFMLELVHERLPQDVRKRVRAQALSVGSELDEFSNPDERAYAKWLMRIRRVTSEIRELREFSRQRRLEGARGSE